MTFAWRREDLGYFAAAIASAAVIAYVLIGNFGLVPSPFAAPATAPTVQAAIDPILAEELPQVEVTPVDRPAPRAPVTPPVPPAAAGDDAPPVVTIRTPAGATFGVTQPAIIEGFATDAGTGLEHVFVQFVAAGGAAEELEATVMCDQGTRNECFWQAEIPAVLGAYTVKAKGVDGAGNSAWTPPIEITVVNTGGAVNQVTDTVARAPSAVGKAVNGLLTGLLNVLN